MRAVRVTVHFFAALREALGTERLSLTLPSSLELSALPLEVAQALGGTPSDQATRRDLLGAPNVRVALNQVLLAEDQVALSEGDELAFLPPVTGG